MDTDGGLCTLIRHKNGNAYLLFRTELYGYSVREMESGRKMHYVPASVHPGEGKAFGKSFIWVEAAYDPRSDLLAVSGCFWGCPYSVAVVDFADPLAAQPVGRWQDVRELIDPGFDNFDDLDFVAWEDGALCLRGSRHGESTQEILLSVERLWNALTNARDGNLILLN